MKHDPVELEIVRNIVAGVAEEMGGTLQRTAFSPNIKERRDFSCAIFDSRGEAAVMGDHMPVHLGSMPMSVKAALNALPLQPGDAVLLNDPYQGGTHLPDITLVSPLFLTSQDTPDLFIANRAHHADVGGMSPGSMPLASEIYQEGLIIPPVKLMERGHISDAVLELILANVRTPEERRGDLNAQLAANALGARRMQELADRYNARHLLELLHELQEYSERMTRAFIADIPDGTYHFMDFMDDDGMGSGPIRLCVKLTIAGDEAIVDFSNTSPQVRGSVNAILAVTLSAVLYSFKAVIGEDVLANSGILRPIRLIVPEGTILNARKPAAVAGGNVETSQRVVDCLLGALQRAVPDRVPAASSGTMNNITFGGFDTRRQKPFAYYETIAGGHGASHEHDGQSARHCHMTNSLNTPVEALEHALPILMECYRIRPFSGGSGMHRGGDGLERSYQFLEDAEVTLLSDRRLCAPWGLKGGGHGQPGHAELEREGSITPLPGKYTGSLRAGDIVRIFTPGGGGYGSRKK